MIGRAYLPVRMKANQTQACIMDLTKYLGLVFMLRTKAPIIVCVCFFHIVGLMSVIGVILTLCFLDHFSRLFNFYNNLETFCINVRNSSGNIDIFSISRHVTLK